LVEWNRVDGTFTFTSKLYTALTKYFKDLEIHLDVFKLLHLIFRILPIIYRHEMCTKYTITDDLWSAQITEADITLLHYKAKVNAIHCHCYNVKKMFKYICHW